MAVLLETSLGDLVMYLYTDRCPNACKNFLKLCKMKFYNSARFFTVQKDHIASIETVEPSTSIFQRTADPQTRFFEDEIHQDLRHTKLGLVSTANVGPNKNDSGFFILLSEVPKPHLDGKHTVFGEIAEGLDVLRAMNAVYTDEDDRPYFNIRIKHTTIIDDPFEDPEELNPPEMSPEPVTNQDERLEFEEKEELMRQEGRTEEEIIKATKHHQAKKRAVVLEMLNDLPDADIKPPDNVLFVCKMNPATQEEDLELIFSRFGPIRSCEVVRDWKTGQSLQYAFIEFETANACEEA